MRNEVAAIAIGRNEGERLARCLASLEGWTHPIIYVDSGSTDGSTNVAKDAGAEVVELDMSRPFTAARARNAGLARLAEIDPDCEFVQFLDGDCELQDGWIEVASAALVADPDLALVCGRRRERFPDASIWNRMIDHEWNTRIGEARACGGDALMRRAALDEVGGYRESLIAGEDPELCYRIRQKGWRVRRIDAEMTAHDAALTRFSQWWQRARRAGYAFAEGAALHGSGSEGYRRPETRRALFWGLGLPMATILALVLFGSAVLLLLLVWPLQVVRLKARGLDWVSAFFLTVGKFPEAQGVLGYWIGRLTGRQRRLIEYK